MKKIIAGFIAGALFASIAAYAANEIMATQAEYPILVNGVQYKSTDKPALNVNGSTYLPLRAMAEVLGVPVKWNQDSRQVEINSASTDTGNSSMKDDVNITFSNVRILKDNEISGIQLDSDSMLVAGNIKIHNSGTTYVSFTPMDLALNYKVDSRSPQAVLNKANEFPDSIIRGNPLIANTGIDNEITFGTIKPYETRLGTVVFKIYKCNVQKYSLTWKSVKEIQAE